MRQLNPPPMKKHPHLTNMYLKWKFRSSLLAALLLSLPALVLAEQAQEVSQYGITWKFDKPHTVGKFVTGDWWVVGPVTVVSVTPMPGPAADNEHGAELKKNRYGVVAQTDDKRMRNGSMVILNDDPEAKPSANASEGYDSRLKCFDPLLSIPFPHTLEVNQSLISTVSGAVYANGKDGMELATPYVPGLTKAAFFPPTLPLVVKDAAVLTCLERVPPVDAFRPPYAGTVKPLYQTKDIRWNLLPKLRPVAAVPDWKMFERIFERPWIDHHGTWFNQHMGPGENQPHYGREFARLTSIAGLMLQLDVPQERKQKLMLEYIQLGIDLHGLAVCGRQWPGSGGHQIGRKWPILFAGLMLDKKELLTFPQVTSFYNDGLFVKITPSTDAPSVTTVFSEDMQTYFGNGGDGQTALYQIVIHTGVQLPHEEKPFAAFDKRDTFVDQYRGVCSIGWPGEALAALHMKAKALWNHDAFFDNCDHWMNKDASARIPDWLHGQPTFDAFVNEMWAAHRKSAPEQPGGITNVKWVWDSEKSERVNGRDVASGHFVANPKAAASK